MRPHVFVREFLGAGSIFVVLLDCVVGQVDRFIKTIQGILLGAKSATQTEKMIMNEMKINVSREHLK